MFVIICENARGNLPSRAMWELKLDTVVLVHRHLPFLEWRGLLVLDQRAQHQLSRQLFLLRQPVGVDRREPLNIATSPRQRVVHRAGRVVRQLRIVALVAKKGRVLRFVLQLVLPDVIQQASEVSRA
jgi:hypothetical protein